MPYLPAEHEVREAIRGLAATRYFLSQLPEGKNRTMALILITDDAAFSRWMIRKALKDGNYELLEASNGLECLEMVATHSPDCILLDLLMPELDGFAVLERLRDQKSNIPAIVLSADIQESTRQQCKELGAFAMLKKPPKAPKIRNAIQQALRAKDADNH